MSRYVAPVHLEGMGLVGSLLAHRLRKLGVRFTWSDTYSKHTAWQASTGSVYPAGGADNAEAWDLWCAWLATMPNVQRRTENARWCYTSKAPPEGGDVDAVAQAGPITVSSGYTIQFNVQRLVKLTRVRFTELETDGPRRRQRVIVTHGDVSAKHFTWGWSALAHIEFSEEFARVLDVLRPAVYMRSGYDLTYIYPRPGFGDFYLGTSTIVQRAPKTRAVDGVLEGAMAKVLERSGGHVRVLAARRLREGWRPKPYDEQEWAWTGDGGDTIYCRPMGGNGVRHFPLLAQAVEELL